MKRYLFSYLHEVDATFEVDTTKFTREAALTFLNFFTWDWDKDEDPIDEAMRKLALAAFKVASGNNYNAFGVANELSEWEAYPLLDGSTGIRILDVDIYEFNTDELDMEVKEVKS